MEVRIYCYYSNNNNDLHCPVDAGHRRIWQTVTVTHRADLMPKDKKKVPAGDATWES